MANNVLNWQLAITGPNGASGAKEDLEQILKENNSHAKAILDRLARLVELENTENYRGPIHPGLPSGVRNFEVRASNRTPYNVAYRQVGQSLFVIGMTKLKDQTPQFEAELRERNDRAVALGWKGVELPPTLAEAPKTRGSRTQRVDALPTKSFLPPRGAEVPNAFETILEYQGLVEDDEQLSVQDRQADDVDYARRADGSYAQFEGADGPATIDTTGYDNDTPVAMVGSKKEFRLSLDLDEEFQIKAIAAEAGINRSDAIRGLLMYRLLDYATAPDAARPALQDPAEYSKGKKVRIDIMDPQAKAAYRAADQLSKPAGIVLTSWVRQSLREVAEGHLTVRAVTAKDLIRHQDFAGFTGNIEFDRNRFARAKRTSSVEEALEPAAPAPTVVMQKEIVIRTVRAPWATPAMKRITGIDNLETIPLVELLAERRDTAKLVTGMHEKTPLAIQSSLELANSKVSRSNNAYLDAPKSDRGAMRSALDAVDLASKVQDAAVASASVMTGLSIAHTKKAAQKLTALTNIIEMRCMDASTLPESRDGFVFSDSDHLASGFRSLINDELARAEQSDLGAALNNARGLPSAVPFGAGKNTLS